MKFLGVLISLTIAWLSTASADLGGYESQYIKPVDITFYSREKTGAVKQEYLRCTPQTCCFSEGFYCFMERGRCICPLNRCEMWPNKKDTKTYWMKISGTEAERYCGRSRMLHELTKLCLCGPDKMSPCNECNPPKAACGTNDKTGTSLPSDCSPY